MSTDVHDKRVDDEARAAARRLRRVIQDEPSLMEAVAYLLDAASPETHASDRLIAIFAGTLLECALRNRMIVSKFKNEALTDGDFDQLFASDRNGVLATFGSRILIGWALSLFGPKAYADLKRVNQIRNAFAHALQPLHFEHQDIRSLCEALGRYELIPYELGRANELRLEALSPSTRDHFVRTVISLAAGLQIQIQADGKLYLRKPFP